MLILDQTKQLIVNLDNVSFIFIEKKTNSIKAMLTGIGSDAQRMHLGTYQSFEDCKKVLGEIACAHTMMSIYKMPLGGEVN